MWHARHSPWPSPLSVHQLRSCTLADTMFLVHLIGASSVRAPISYGLNFTPNVSSLYAHGLPPYWATPVVIHSIITMSPRASPAPTTLTVLGPTVSAQRGPPLWHPKVIHKEKDLTQLEHEVISSPWCAANAHEPPCEGIRSHTISKITDADATEPVQICIRLHYIHVPPPLWSRPCHL